MIRVQLVNMDTDAPWWWSNFVRAHTIEGGATISELHEHIDRVLMDYSAIMWTDGRYGTYLDFYDQHAYDWFILRWSWSE